jgi:hypothetical protein
MKARLQRPPLSSGRGGGPLRFEQFQVAYVTSDIDRACAVFGERYGLRAFRRLEGPLKEGGQIRIEIAWAGATLYELVWAEGPGSAFYADRLPAGRFAIRHHHLGFLVPDEESWDGLQAQIAQGGWQVMLRTEVPGFMKACYIAAPELDHYLEYLLPEPAGREFFEGAPSF